jgi:hypothetical protein
MIMSIVMIPAVVYPQRAVDPPDNAPRHPSHHATYRAADRSKCAMAGARALVGAFPNTFSNALSLHPERYGDQGENTGTHYKTSLHETTSLT